MDPEKRTESITTLPLATSEGGPDLLWQLSSFEHSREVLVASCRAYKDNPSLSGMIRISRQRIVTLDAFGAVADSIHTDDSRPTIDKQLTSLATIIVSDNNERAKNLTAITGRPYTTFRETPGYTAFDTLRRAYRSAIAETFKKNGPGVDASAMLYRDINFRYASLLTNHLYCFRNHVNDSTGANFQLITDPLVLAAYEKVLPFMKGRELGHSALAAVAFRAQRLFLSKLPMKPFAQKK